jgi:aryl-alcohol dehydrogenase-like predicted oxidoreductase
LKLALGTAQFGLEYGISNSTGVVSEGEAGKILSLCSSVGMDTLDTAMLYGSSESCIGKYNQNNIFKIITKVPAIPSIGSGIESWLRREVSISVERLNSHPLYALLLHRPEQLLDSLGGEIYKALRQLKDDGIVMKIGISAYSPSLIDQISSKFEIDIVQAPFNIFDHRMISSGCFSKLKSQGIEVHARSIFLQGLLLLKRDNIPVQFYKWRHILEAWHKWLQDVDVSALEACTSYALKPVEIDKIVVGVESEMQLREVVNVINAGLTLPFPEFSNLSEDLIDPSKWAS